MNVAAWALPELIEAASRTGQNDCAQGIHARSRALLSDGEDAETSYREAIERLGRTPLRPELARAHLLYGEWLRRPGRRAGAAAHRPRHVHRDRRGCVRRAGPAASWRPAARPSAGGPLA